MIREAPFSLCGIMVWSVGPPGGRALNDHFWLSSCVHSSGGGSRQVPADERAGLLTLPSVLAVGAYAVHPAPILRGKRILERLICQELGAPPPNAEAAAPPEVAAEPRDISLLIQKNEVVQANRKLAVSVADMEQLLGIKPAGLWMGTADWYNQSVQWVKQDLNFVELLDTMHRVATRIEERIPEVPPRAPGGAPGRLL